MAIGWFPPGGWRANCQLRRADDAILNEVIVAQAGGESAGDRVSYDVIAVRYGTRSTTRSDIFLHYPLYGEPDAAARMDYFFWVLRRADTTILVDCGFNAVSGGRRGRTMLSTPADALRQLGIEPADVSLLIATHAHYDHIGNLDAFGTAEVVMSEREYDFWTGPLASRPLFATSAEADDIDALRRANAAGRLRLLSGRTAVAPGIEVIDIGGHTPGQLIVTAELADGTAVIASDALHYYEEMRLDRPFTHVADLPAMYTGFELLRSLTRDGSHYLVAGHDPEVMQRFSPVDETPLAVRIGPPAGDR
jgi:glyoxylase-like metal-dependent hydrolase (beta-lactamase superfamily II)